MLTDVGQKILKELENELQDDMDDSSKDFLLNDTLGVIAFFGLWAGQIARYAAVAFCLLCIAILMSLDSETLQTLQQMNTEDLADSITLFVRMVIGFGILTSVMLWVFSMRGFGTTSKGRYKRNNKQYLSAKKDDIEVIEEVLYRHGLISKDNNNG